ncbi:MAG TPA: hypothetical protein VHL58_14200 [Thermoanaerobaculia bacterium]|nr:hypothetical protein [Thermoanaerobaculia bacterium]
MMRDNDAIACVEPGILPRFLHHSYNLMAENDAPPNALLLELEEVGTT